MGPSYMHAYTVCTDGLAGGARLLAHLPPSRTVAMPAPHAGVGLGVYTKATSPLRRYGDVIVHRQLRALAMRSPLPWDAGTLADALPILAERERAVARAQAMSERYWTLVHLGARNPH